MHRDATFALHPLVEHAVKQGAAVVAERGAGVRVHLEPVLGPRALYKQHTRYLCVRYTAISSGLLAERDNWCPEHVFGRKQIKRTKVYCLPLIVIDHTVLSVKKSGC